MSGATTWATKGSTITGLVRDDICATYMVLSRCPEQCVAWWCEPHRKSMPTLEHMVLHLQDVDGPHHLAIECPRHRYEAPADTQMRALVGTAAS